MISTLKFPFSFNPVKLADDLRQFDEADWTPHFNTGYYEGDWSGIALRASRGAAIPLYPDPTAENNFTDTDNLRRCSYLTEVLAAFDCEIETARLLRLGAGAKIREHRDFKLGYEDGAARIHIPIQTNSQVEFFLDNQLVEMKAGEVWYLNFNLPHRVQNNGAAARVHLVLDCLLNNWLDSFFKNEPPAPKDKTKMPEMPD